MPRQPRIDLPGIPQHGVEGGNDRRPCFFQSVDHVRYQDELREAATRNGCAIHAYVLMTNHVHLLATPPETGALAQLMQTLGRQYVGQFNARHRRTGTLWEGRYKSCLVDSADYLLRCVCYIDLNPVRARLTNDPARFPWSSCAALCGQRDDPLLTLHPTQLAMGTSDKDRPDAYRDLLTETLDDETLAAIRAYLQQQRLRPRRLPGDGRSQDAARCRGAAGPSANAKPG